MKNLAVEPVPKPDDHAVANELQCRFSARCLGSMRGRYTIGESGTKRSQDQLSTVTAPQGSRQLRHHPVDHLLINAGLFDDLHVQFRLPAVNEKPLPTFAARKRLATVDQRGCMRALVCSPASAGLW